MFQTLHEISKNLIFVFVWKYVWKYVNINVSDIKKKKKDRLFSGLRALCSPVPATSPPPPPATLPLLNALQQC